MENQILSGNEAKKFIDYEKLRRLGHCNMYDMKCVGHFTKLGFIDVTTIIENYNKLSAKYAKELANLDNINTHNM